MKKFLIITKKKWDYQNYKNLGKSFIISDDLNLKKINELSPDIIFFIHWSKKVVPEILNSFFCIQFHSSNLPKFKGGSPIQNQIIRGKKITNITAFKMSNKIDSGAICLKKKLSLEGSAEQIFKRMEKISISMIKILVKKKKLYFRIQKGKSSYFKRRSPLQSNIKYQKKLSLNKIYDFIRMLDAPAYPKAYIKLGKYKILFERIKKIDNSNLEGKFKIVKR